MKKLVICSVCGTGVCTVQDLKDVQCPKCQRSTSCSVKFEGLKDLKPGDIVPPRPKYGYSIIQLWVKNPDAPEPTVVDRLLDKRENLG